MKQGVSIYFCKKIEYVVDGKNSYVSDTFLLRSKLERHIFFVRPLETLQSLSVRAKAPWIWAMFRWNIFDFQITFAG